MCERVVHILRKRNETEQPNLSLKPEHASHKKLLKLKVKIVQIKSP